MNRNQRRNAARGSNGSRKSATHGQPNASGAAQNGATRKSLTVGMGGFDGLIHDLGRVPLDVNRALPLIERNDLEKADGLLTDALIKVELAKAAILGNLALASMKAGDIEKACGYIDIALESLTELGLEGTELGKMLALVHANLPGGAATGGAATGDTATGDTATDDTAASTDAPPPSDAQPSS